jgi:hypothetical protein
VCYFCFTIVVDLLPLEHANNELLCKIYFFSPRGTVHGTHLPTVNLLRVLNLASTRVCVHAAWYGLGPRPIELAIFILENTMQ